MNRRKFLNWFAIGAGAVAVAPTVIASCDCSQRSFWEGLCEYHSIEFMKASPVIHNYADYTNFSKFAVEQSFDEAVSNAAAELGKALAEEINRMPVSCG